MSAWSNPRQLLSCLLVSSAAFGTIGVEPSSLTGTMNVARSGHQATLLMDGRVLVTGGSDSRGKAIGVAEIFNPVTGVWSVAAANLVPRLGHSASLLHDGRVIVVGGLPFASSCQSIGSAEVYDPSTDRWSVTSKIPVPVGRGTVAVSLKDGRVLIAGGGTGCGDVYSSAALFDPSSNTWSQTAAMDAPAEFHIAARLADGRVLVSGAATIVYDPQSARWAPLGDPRSLIQPPCEGDLRTYSPALRRNSLIAQATSDDCPSVTMLPADTLLVAGGLSTSNTAQGSVQLLDRRTGENLGSWPMHVARVGHTATRLENGAVLIAGGSDGAARLASSEIYIPRLSYEASSIGIPRGWVDDRGSIYYGDWLAAATNSHDNVLISYKGASGVATQLLEWNPRQRAGAAHTPPPKRNARLYPPYVRSLGENLPDLNSIRIDGDGNIWGVSSAAQAVLKISAEGRVLLRFGSQQPTETDHDSGTPRAQRSGHDFESPSDVAVDRRGNVFVTDTGDRPRILKFDSRGRLLAATGSKGSRPGELDRPHSMATDASGNVYVADSGNARIQVFDNSLNLRAVYGTIGTPWAICITNGARQFVYSVSNPDKTERARRTVEIYKLEVDGTILGKAVGDEPSALIQTLDHIHCRRATTIVGVGERNLHVITFAR